MGGPSVYPKVSDEVLSTGSTHKWGSSSEEDGLRRTIYVFQRRSLVLPDRRSLRWRGYDQHLPASLRRPRSRPRPWRSSTATSARTEVGLLRRPRRQRTRATIKAKQIERAYQIALCRRPTAAQKQTALDFLTRQAQMHLDPTHQANNGPSVQQVGFKAPDNKAQKEAARAALADFCHVLINTNEFIYLD